MARGGVLERGALEAKKGLELGAILEIAGARSAKGKSGGWSAERQVQKGRSAERQGQKWSERGALFAPAPPPPLGDLAIMSRRKIKLKV